MQNFYRIYDYQEKKYTEVGREKRPIESGPSISKSNSLRLQQMKFFHVLRMSTIEKADHSPRDIL